MCDAARTITCRVCNWACAAIFIRRRPSPPWRDKDNRCLVWRPWVQRFCSKVCAA